MSIQTSARLAALVEAACPIISIAVGVAGQSATVKMQFDPSATAQQKANAQAIVDGFDWSAASDAVYAAQQAKAAATSDIDKGDLQAGTTSQRQLVALVLMILDEFNLHALKLNAILDAVDAATSLADLKTRIGAIPDYPTRTKAQLIAALKANIAATAE